MKKLIADDRARVGAWVAEKVGRATPWVSEPALGLEKDGELVAGIVIDSIASGARGSMHCAGVGKYWLNREFLFACFDYAFNQLDLKVLLNPVGAGNSASIRFTSHIGFEEVSRIPKAWDGKEELVLFSLAKEDCRWLSLGELKHAR